MQYLVIGTTIFLINVCFFYFYLVSLNVFKTRKIFSADFSFKISTSSKSIPGRNSSKPNGGCKTVDYSTIYLQYSRDYCSDSNSQEESYKKHSGIEKLENKD